MTALAGVELESLVSEPDAPGTTKKKLSKVKVERDSPNNGYSNCAKFYSFCKIGQNSND